MPRWWLQRARRVVQRETCGCHVRRSAGRMCLAVGWRSERLPTELAAFARIEERFEATDIRPDRIGIVELDEHDRGQISGDDLVELDEQVTASVLGRLGASLRGDGVEL